MDNPNFLRIMVAFFCWVGLTFTSKHTTTQFFDKASDGLPWEKVLLVTTLQTGGGAILFIVMVLTNHSNPVMDFKTILLGVIHSYGVLMANSSMFMVYSTILTQVSGLFFTTVISRIIDKIVLSIRIIITLFVISVVCLLSEPFVNSFTPFALFALACSIADALTNTGLKYSKEPLGEKKTTIDGFASISFGGFLSLLPLWFIMLCFDSR